MAMRKRSLCLAALLPLLRWSPASTGSSLAPTASGKPVVLDRLCRGWTIHQAAREGQLACQLVRDRHGKQLGGHVDTSCLRARLFRVARRTSALSGGNPAFHAQVKNGYRFNGDDILLAREAARAAPTATRLLDLGAGTGSVGLFWLAQQPPGEPQPKCGHKGPPVATTNDKCINNADTYNGDEQQRAPELQKHHLHPH